MNSIANIQTGTNNAQSYAQKLDIVNLICFLSQKMSKKDPKRYSSCLSVLSIIFNNDFSDMSNDRHCTQVDPVQIRSFGLICDSLLWGTNDDIPKPEGFNNVKEIKDKIITYFTEEWIPF